MSTPITHIILTLASGCYAGSTYSYSAPASALTEKQLAILEGSTPSDREASGIPSTEEGAPWTSLSPQKRIELQQKDGNRCVTYEAFYDE